VLSLCLLTVNGGVEFGDSPRRRFQFEKRSEFFVGPDDEPLSIAAMRIGNEDCWPAGRDHIMISALVS